MLPALVLNRVTFAQFALRGYSYQTKPRQASFLTNPKLFDFGFVPVIGKRIYVSLTLLTMGRSRRHNT